MGLDNVEAEDLFLRDYETVRAENAQARAAQQTIMQYSLAAMGVLFAAGVTVLSGSSAVRFQLGVAVFGVALPAGSFAACAIWLGEVIRMGRTGAYLRGRERATWDEDRRFTPMTPKDVFDQPLAWENYQASFRSERTTGHYANSYVASVALFGGAVASSAMISLIAVFTHDFHHLGSWYRASFAAYAAFGLAAFIVVLVRQVRTVSVMAIQGAGLPLDFYRLKTSDDPHPESPPP